MSEAESGGNARRNIPQIHYGGAEGIRTPDLLTASQALSQLSYSPTSGLFILQKDVITVKNINCLQHIFYLNFIILFSNKNLTHIFKRVCVLVQID